MPILAGSTGGPLLQAADLADYPGAPFTDTVVLSVGESIRSATGWHIAPSLTETLTLEGAGGRWLILPTLHLTAVTEVRDVSDPDNPVVLNDWSAANTPRFRAGCLRRDCGWPCGDIEVDIVHGYDSCPADLLPAAAALARAGLRDSSVASQSAGPYSQGISIQGITLETDSVAAAIARYRLPARP